ncbi:hypothetical protein ACD578_27690 (plasmid) [Microvirga sp. RSM25]|uniref:hypothetical protein n=1 Tax=Microvirga sp. RSM25 TaxID=3273802 RepID=UPI00384E45C1
MPKAIRYDTLETFAEVDGLHLSLVKADGEEDGFLHGPPCLHLLLNAPDGAYERVFTVQAGYEDLARAIGQGMTLALSTARAEWESSAPAPPSRGQCVVIPFPVKSEDAPT